MSATPTIAHTNGHAAEAPDPLAAFKERTRQLDEAADDLGEGLEQLLADERELVIELQNLVTRCREREKRIAKALVALGFSEDEPAPGPAPKPKKPSERKRYASEEAIEKTFRALVELGGERRQSELSEATGLSTPTISQSLTVLRETERVRIARVENQSKYYAPMPGSADA